MQKKKDKEEYFFLFLCVSNLSASQPDSSDFEFNP